MVIVVDPSLLGAIPVDENVAPDGILIANTTRTVAEARGLLTLNGQRVACIDATQIAVDCFGMQKPNTPTDSCGSLDGTSGKSSMSRSSNRYSPPPPHTA